jgi:hypothetical protein
VGQVRPLRLQNEERAHRPPRGKRASWNGNQPLSREQQSLRKKDPGQKS